MIASNESSIWGLIWKAQYIHYLMNFQPFKVGFLLGGRFSSEVMFIRGGAGICSASYLNNCWFGAVLAGQPVVGRRYLARPTDCFRFRDWFRGYCQGCCRFCLRERETYCSRHIWKVRLGSDQSCTDCSNCCAFCMCVCIVWVIWIWWGKSSDSVESVRVTK